MLLKKLAAWYGVYRALNSGILAEDLAVKGILRAGIFRDIVLALGVGVHMVKLAVALAYDGFPDKKLGGDCPAILLASSGSSVIHEVLALPCHP